MKRIAGGLPEYRAKNSCSDFISRDFIELGWVNCFALFKVQISNFRWKSFATTLFLGTLIFLSNGLFADSIGETAPPGPPPESEPASTSVFQTMQLVGFKDDWTLGNKFGRMKNTHDTLWEGREYFEAGSFECLFIANSSWKLVWGKGNDNTGTSTSSVVTGTAFPRGGKLPITIPASGPYQILFDDRTGVFNFNLADGRLPPVARAGRDQQVGIGVMVRFSAVGSYDPDGYIATYSWSNGLFGISPVMIYNEPGEYIVTLTVFDNSGNSASDSVKITVSKDILVEADFRRETIYAVPVTRFFDGDGSNNFYCRARIDKDDPHWRGDFKGLIDHLDHIRQLGFTAIMVTPPTECRGELDFLGYNTYDWKKVDPRLESYGTKYLDLINAVHSRGMKIVQEIVLNHSSNYGIRGEVFIDRLPHKFYRMAANPAVWPYVFNWGDYTKPFREDNDNPRAPEWFQDYLFRDPWGRGPLIDSKTNTTLPLEGYNPARFFGTDESLLSTEWYHHNGWLPATMSNDVFSVQNKHLDADSIDFATENWKVRNYLNDAAFRFIDLGVDGFMVKFARNMDRDHILSMVDEWRKRKPDLFICAEVECDNVGWGQADGSANPSELAPWWYTRAGNAQANPDSGQDSKLAVCDYPLFNSFGPTLVKGNFGGLGIIFAMDWVYGNPTKLVTFFQSRTRGPEQGPGRFNRFSGPTTIAELTYDLIFTARGIPCLQMGEEIEFQKGLPLSPIAQGQTLSQTALAYFGGNLATGTINSAMSNPVFQHLKRLNMIRSLLPALQTGVMLNVKEWISGLSFVRQTSDPETTVVVGLSSLDQDITVDRIPNGRYSDAISGLVQTVASNTITFSVKAYSAGIWAKNGPGKIGEGGNFK
ncbi:MAG: PKD domain-containing protein [Candidatus Riflebacteria bacterium]|nr:PKD domain-containing protein [Candidatus Riflebacteria bacterium]